MSNISDDRKRLADLFAIASDGKHEQLTAAEIEAQLERKDVTAIYHVNRDALLTALFAIVGARFAKYRPNENLVKGVEPSGTLWKEHQKSREQKARIHGDESIRAEEAVVAEMFLMARIKYCG